MHLRAKPRKKTKEFYAADKIGKKLFKAGVPQRYWGVTLDYLPPPSDFVVPSGDGKNKRVTSTKQYSDLASILSTDGLGHSGLVLASSYPTDEWAVSLASLVIKQAVQSRYLHVEMLDVSNPIPTGEPLLPDVLALYNVTAESSAGRIAACRDWIHFCEGAFIILSVGGSEPRVFAHERLRMEADFEFYREGQFRLRKVLRT